MAAILYYLVCFIDYFFFLYYNINIINTRSRMCALISVNLHEDDG